MMKKCRVCQEEIQGEALLHYKNMPIGAQAFLEEEELSNDVGEDLSVYACAYCGTFQILGEPVSYYKDVIRATAVSPELKSYKKEQFARFLADYDLQDKRLLEVGCGTGDFLEILTELGVDCYGIEHKPQSVATCLEKSLQVSQDFIENSTHSVKYAPFDGFLILNFLEHIPQPKTFLQGIAHNLKENAVGFVEVPNLNHILRDSSFSEFISDHLLYFTTKTLKFLLESAGFEVLSCEELWHDYVLTAVVRKRPSQKLEGFSEKLEQCRVDLKKFIEKHHSQGGKVAVWGASHQALAVIALTEIASKLEYVVDSAPFKQNKYTPATHLKVVSPDILADGAIDAIIIMASSFSDEVARIIEKDYSHLEYIIFRGDHVEWTKN